MKPKDTNPWENHIGGKMHALANRLRRQRENSETFRRLETITGNNGRIIAYLSCNEGKDVFQKDIEHAFGVTRSTASKVLTLMEKKGLIERQSVPSDARLKRILLTERSRELSREMCAESDRMDKRLLCGFTPEEKALLHAYLDRMLGNLEDPSHS